MEQEDRYERLELIVKSRLDGETWFDIIHDYITGDCQDGGGECITDDLDEDCDLHEHTEEFPCTCGMESMGGTSGTLDQCYEAGEKIGYNITRLDAARAIVALVGNVTDEDEALVNKVVKWAEDEIRFEEEWNK